MAAPGKSCGTCGLCCKLLGVDGAQKAAGDWCRHYAKGGGGCRIYADRPGECRTFECEWLRSETLPDEWRPDRSKMILVTESDGKRMNVIVDPGQPMAWRQTPYYERIKRMSVRSLDGYQLVICIGQRRIVVFPDQEADLGIIDPEAKIISGYADRDGEQVPYAVVLRNIEQTA